MTVQKDVTKNIYVGNGSTRTFPFTFECPAEHPEYIKVYLMQDDGTALAASDYQLDMDARQITYPSSGTALPEGKKLVIMRELPLQQVMNLVNNGPYFAEDVELAFDENVMAMQQIAEKLNRSIIMSVDIDGDAFVNEVPFEAGKSFRIADDGKSIVLTEDPARVLPLAQEAYAQAQAQAQSAYSSAAAAAKSEDSAAASASEAGNSAQSASVSAASAAESARLAEGYKNVAETAKSDAALYANNAKTSADNATASKKAAQSAATTASNFASAARSSASEARTYRDNAKTYMDNTELYMNNAKNYSENVNVFIPSVSSAGVLSWTNKAGLTNPASVNIKGAKGDAGTAATITIGSVTTGEPGTNASVTNSGTTSNAVLNFTIPRGEKGAGEGTSVIVDATLSSTSTNAIANKAVYDALLGKVGTDIFSGFTLTSPTSIIAWRQGSQFLGSINATNYTGTAGAAIRDNEGNTIAETYAKKGTANTWGKTQTFEKAICKEVTIAKEIYGVSYTDGGAITLATNVVHHVANSEVTLDMAQAITDFLSVDATSTVFSIYITTLDDSAAYPLIITNAGTLKYVGSASDLAITGAGLLLNILMVKDSSGNVTSIVRASKLEGGA